MGAACPGSNQQKVDNVRENEKQEKGRCIAKSRSKHGGRATHNIIQAEALAVKWGGCWRWLNLCYYQSQI